MEMTAYRTATSTRVAFLMSCNDISECADYLDYVKIAVNLTTLPVDLMTFIKSFNQFSILADGTVTQEETPLTERKISTLAVDTGMAVGHANTANIFTRL